MLLKPGPLIWLGPLTTNIITVVIRSIIPGDNILILECPTIKIKLWSGARRKIRRELCRCS